MPLNNATALITLPRIEGISIVSVCANVSMLVMGGQIINPLANLNSIIQPSKHVETPVCCPVPCFGCPET